MFVNHMSGVDFLPKKDKKKERKAETEGGKEVERNKYRKKNLHLLLVLGVKPSV